MKVINKNMSLLFYLIIVSLSVCFLQNECFASRKQLLKRPAPQPATVAVLNTPLLAEDEEQQQIHFIDKYNGLENIIQTVLQRNNQNTRQLIQQINIPHIPEDILRREQFLEEMKRREAVMLKLIDNLQTIATDLNGIMSRLTALENANNHVRALTNTKYDGYRNFTTTDVVVGGTVIAGIGAAAGYVLCRFFRGR